MTTRAADHPSLQLPEFCRLPANYVHPQRLAACVPDIPPALAERLRSVARLRSKLSDIVARHAGLEPCGGCAANESAASWPLDRLMQLADRAGAIWHAQSLRSIILGRTLAQVLAGFDADLRDVAIRHLALAPPDGPQIAPADLAQAIRSDGMHCLTAWIAELPACARSRLILKLPPDVSLASFVSTTHREHGRGIIDHLVADSSAALMTDRRS
ncbi:SctK family type III secretion system sorting platform protein [Bradyrhizobium sp. USDA 4353]